MAIPETRVQRIVRVAPGADGVSIWSFALFGDPEGTHLREFLARVFSVEDVAAVEIRRAESFGRVHYDPSANAPDVWLKLSRALGRTTSPPSDRAVGHLTPLGAENLYLDGAQTLPIWVNRVGSSLSTWRLRYQSDDRIRITHPILLNRKDVAYRLEEELSAILGVEEFRTSTLTSSVAIRFNPRLIKAERLIRELEKSWPRLLDGLEGPPSARRLVVAGGLLGLAFTGQYLVPSLRRVALAGVALYGYPNVKNGAKQLTHGEVGLPVLYSAGLTFTLLSGMPFSSALMAVLMQFWPLLTHRTMTRSQRRLFAVHRQRVSWARKVLDDGAEVEVDTDALAAGDLITVRTGETIPVDGVVTDGLAAVDEEALSGAVGAADKTPGDAVYAATFVRDGHLIVRVERSGVDTVAGYIGAHLPHSRIDHLLSSAEAERIANRNAKAALAVAGLTILGTRRLRPAQAVIRPDYATAPRLSAQLNALHDLGEGLQRGIFFRDPAALDRLSATDVYVFDDSSGLERRQLEVAEVFSAPNVSAKTVLGYATAAFPIDQNERARALLAHTIKQDASVPEIFQRSRHAGVIRYRDIDNRVLDIAAPGYLSAAGIKVPARIADAIAASPFAWSDGRGRSGNQPTPHEEASLRPLWILRDGEILGAITFRRQGEAEGTEIIAALRARIRRARFVYISSHPRAAAESIADRFGITTVFAGLDGEAKASAIRELGRRTMWIGDGASTETIPSIEASAVSISVGGASTAPFDAADIVLLQPGLQNLVSLRRIGRGHRASLESDYRTVYTANLFAVAGGLFARFGSLEAGLTSNAGTGLVYFRRWRKLRRLISRIESRRAIVKASSQGESDRLADTTLANDAERLVDYRDLDPSAVPERDIHGV